MLKPVCHPNIIPFHGVTLDPLQLVFDWMENGALPEFLKEHPNTNRFGLVRVTPTVRLVFQNSQAIH